MNNSNTRRIPRQPRALWRALSIGLVLFFPAWANAYPNCWTQYFHPGDYNVTFDNNGLRYIANFPSGLTCGCTVNPTQIWFYGSNRQGATAATLMAIASAREMRFYLQDFNSDGVCRAEIVELKPGS